MESIATAIIPARGGSKGIPNKNLAKVGGISLVGRAITVCQKSEVVNQVIVSTDSEEIAEEAERHGAIICFRPKELAGDFSRSEESLEHAILNLSVTSELIAFVECTSPFIDHNNLETAAGLVTSHGFDSVFSATETYELFWQDAGEGVFPMSHDPSTQTMRQERLPLLKETGAFYLFTRRGFEDHRNRFFGRVGYVVTDSLHGIEIDFEQDLVLANMMASSIDKDLGYF